MVGLGLPRPFAESPPSAGRGGAAVGGQSRREDSVCSKTAQGQTLVSTYQVTLGELR